MNIIRDTVQPPLLKNLSATLIIFHLHQKLWLRTAEAGFHVISLRYSVAHKTLLLRSVKSFLCCVRQGNGACICAVRPLLCAALMLYYLGRMSVIIHFWGSAFDLDFAVLATAREAFSIPLSCS